MSEHRDQDVTTDTARAVSIVHALASAYDLDVTFTPYASATPDARRAVSDLAPLISETTVRRFAFVELITLRAYAEAIETALGLLDTLTVMSDAGSYDSRSDEGTCIAFAGWDGTEHTIATLRARGPRATYATEHPARVVELETGRTVSDILTANAELERVAFADSRARWTQDSRHYAL